MFVKQILKLKISLVKRLQDKRVLAKQSKVYKFILIILLNKI
jgi:hypothetical protein